MELIFGHFFSQKLFKNDCFTFQTPTLDNITPNKDKLMISKTLALAYDIRLKRHPKIPMDSPEFFNLTIN